MAFEKFFLSRCNLSYDVIRVWIIEAMSENLCAK